MLPLPFPTIQIEIQVSNFQKNSRTELGSSSISFDSVAQQKFERIRKAFPSDLNVVKAGGWYNLQRLSVDPKQALVNLIVDGLKNQQQKKVEFESNEETLEALLILLYGMGKGFEADLVDGDWALVFSKQGTKSPRFQKLVGKSERAGFTLNTFDVKSMTFSGEVKLLKKGLVHSTVKVRLHADERTYKAVISLAEF